MRGKLVNVDLGLSDDAGDLTVARAPFGAAGGREQGRVVDGSLEDHQTGAPNVDGRGIRIPGQDLGGVGVDGSGDSVGEGA
ncbi:TPA_asm: US3.6 sORF [Human alphaherpesvirus 1]|nr:TPA_asm: US3.6 sORF [Human alphaherpesvirus 1]